MAYDAPPYTRDSSLAAAEAQPDIGRRAAKSFAALALFAAMLALMVSLQLFQVTSEGAAKRTLRRATAVLIEIDPLVERHYDDLQTRAEAIGDDETLRLPDYPIAVDLSRGETLGATQDELRRLLLARSADRLYDDGTSALRVDSEEAGDIGAFSIAGLTDNGLGFLRQRNHTALGVLTVALAALCALLAAALAACCRGYGRLAAIGVVVLAAGLPVLLFGVVLRLYAQTGADGGSEYLQREFFIIGEELALVPIRTGIAFAALGLALAATGGLLAVWSDRRAR